MQHNVVAHEEVEEQVVKEDEEKESIRTVTTGRASQKYQPTEIIAHSTSKVSQHVESKHSGEHVQRSFIPPSPIVMDN